MRKLKFTFSRTALNQIYLSYILSILEYSCIVWDGCSVQNINSLQRIQNEAARIVTGLTRSVSLENLYRECGWVTLEERPKQQKLIFMYRSVNGLVPTYISDITPPLVHETTDYPLRNQNNITIPFCRTEISRRSCIPSSITLWNALDEELRASPSLASFKYQLKKRQNNSMFPRSTLQEIDISQLYMLDSEISAVICFQICFEIFCLPLLFVIVLQKVKMLSITCLDARTF